MTPPSSRGKLLMLPLLERRPGVCLIGAENKCFVLHLFLEVVVVAEAGVKAEASRHSVLMCAHEVLEADVALDEVRGDIIEAVLGVYAPGLASWSALSAAELAFFVAVDSLEAQEGNEALEAKAALDEAVAGAEDEVEAGEALEAGEPLEILTARVAGLAHIATGARRVLEGGAGE